MSELRRRMIEDMQLRGLSYRTQESYASAVRSLAKYYMRSPDQLSQEEIRRFFLHLINERRASSSTVRIYLSGIKFFYENTLKQEWTVLDLIRPQKRRKLPLVLSQAEVKQILALIKSPIARMALTLIYSCGLRLSEGVGLQMSDIDGERMLVRISNGKGGRDRNVPLPNRILKLLLLYLKKTEPKRWLFPSRDGQRPIAHCTLQRAFKAALRQSDIQKKASIHSLRHSYATHLMENGVNLRMIQETLGHRSPKSTAIYTHLTQKTIDSLNATVNGLMASL